MEVSTVTLLCALLITPGKYLSSLCIIPMNTLLRVYLFALSIPLCSEASCCTFYCINFSAYLLLCAHVPGSELLKQIGRIGMNKLVCFFPRLSVSVVTNGAAKKCTNCRPQRKTETRENLSSVDRDKLSRLLPSHQLSHSLDRKLAGKSTQSTSSVD